MRTLFTGALLRLYIACICVGTAYVGLVEPRSLMSQVANDAGVLGQTLLYAFMAMGLTGIADVVVNDIMPAKYVLKRPLRYRHLIYMFISVAYASELFLSLHYTSAWATFPVFTTHAVFAAVAAFTDVRQRFALTVGAK